MAWLPSIVTTIPRIGENPSALTRLRPAKINFYLKYMAEQGFRGEDVLEGTGISPHHLRDPLYLVEISKYIRIISNINRLARSPSLAFALGARLTLGDLGILGYGVMSCDNTDEATALWHKYNPIFFGTLIQVAYEKRGSQVLISHLPHPDIREDLLQFLIEEKICYDMALQRLIGLEKFPIEHLALTYPKPAHAQCYTDLIHCPIEFGAARNAMLLRDNALAIPLQGHDPETHQHCLKLLNDVFNSINAGTTLSHKVRAILSENAHRNPAITEVAAQLFVTSRTLNRTLAKEGVNFTDLNVSVRLETIRNLIATTKLESKEIADRVGFSDVRSLRRFFKAHTAKTLQQFRLETVSVLNPPNDVHRAKN